MIKFERVSLQYSEGVKALNKIDLNIDRGEMVFIIGQSGAGKSSLIKTLLKEVSIDSGYITVDDQDITRLHRRKIPRLRRKIGMVFQDFRLLQKKTVYENVAYAMEIMGFGRRLIRENVPVALRLVGLQEKANYYPHKLSGGEAQRVSIARAMVNKPAVLVADEPTGNLDSQTSREILKILMALNNKGTTIIVVTHDEELIRLCNSRVIEMKEGRIVSDSNAAISVAKNNARPSQINSHNTVRILEKAREQARSGSIHTDTGGGYAD